MSTCPCGSNLDYEQCCEPLIKGVRQAETAEHLMRSRYCAYVRAEIDYLVESTHPGNRSDYDLKGTRRWAEKSQWDGLRIISTENGGPEDIHGKVEFIAYYRYKDSRATHHETAEFVKENGRWYFQQGKMVPQKQVVRTDAKTSRNDPCPCGSGLKFKKCCGK